MLGGAALKGGAGSIPGAFLGVIFITMIQNMLIISRVPVYWQAIVVGVVLIGASRRNTSRADAHEPGEEPIGVA